MAGRRRQLAVGRQRHLYQTAAPGRDSRGVFLNIDIANDGSFSGQWGEYTCVPSIGAYGVATYNCRSSKGGEARSSR
jgi:hypothetical protein